MSSDWPNPETQPAPDSLVGPALAALAHQHGLQHGYVPGAPLQTPLTDGSLMPPFQDVTHASGQPSFAPQGGPQVPTAHPQPEYQPYSAPPVPTQPVGHAYPAQSFGAVYPGQPVMQQYPSQPPVQAYPVQSEHPYQPQPIAQAHPGEPGQPVAYSHQPQPVAPGYQPQYSNQPAAPGYQTQYPSQPAPQSVAPQYPVQAQAPFHPQQPVGQPYQAQPSCDPHAPQYVQAPAQPFQPVQGQPMHPQQQSYAPQHSYPVQPGYSVPAPAYQAQQSPYGSGPQSYPDQPPVARHYPDPLEPSSFQMQQPEGFTVRPPIGRGIHAQASPALLRSADELTEKKPWHLSDDAPRYTPPGSAEADLDPFGLAALPEHVVYHGPKDIPNEAVYGLLFGLCSLMLFPLAFLGFARARRAGSMIDAAPSRFKGRFVVLLGFALNIACPIMSVSAGAYLFGLI